MSDMDIMATAIPALLTDTVGPDGKQMQTPLVSGNQSIKRRRVTQLISDAATAGTAVTETNIGYCDAPNGWKVIAAYAAFPIAVTASASVYATFTLSKRTGSGAAVTVATLTTNTSGANGGIGSATAFVPYAFTLSATAANLKLAQADAMTIAVAKASTGTALTAATSYVNIFVVYEEI